MGGRFGKYGDAKRSVSVSHPGGMENTSAFHRAGRALRDPEFLRRFHDPGGIGCRIAPQYDSCYGAGQGREISSNWHPAIAGHIASDKRSCF